eukprot:5403398-Prymnesium_polylepis.1
MQRSAARSAEKRAQSIPQPPDAHGVRLQKHPPAGQEASGGLGGLGAVSYTHLRAHETLMNL